MDALVVVVQALAPVHVVVPDVVEAAVPAPAAHVVRCPPAEAAPVLGADVATEPVVPTRGVVPLEHAAATEQVRRAAGAAELRAVASDDAVPVTEHVADRVPADRVVPADRSAVMRHATPQSKVSTLGHVPDRVRAVDLPLVHPRAAATRRGPVTGGRLVSAVAEADAGHGVAVVPDGDLAGVVATDRAPGVVGVVGPSHVTPG